MKKIVILIMMMCASAQIFSQISGEIRGKILDAKTGEILPGPTIFVDFMGSRIAASADKDGRFVIKPLNPGTYNVYITFMGYDTLIHEAKIVYPDKTTFLEDSYLKEAVNGIYLRPAVITAVQPVDPAMTSVTYIDAKIFDDMPEKEISSIIRNYFTDISVSDDGEEIYFRGSRNGDAIYYVDGVKTRDSNPHVPGCAIGSIAVYTGGVPANYGDFTGGVVVIETKSYFSWANSQKAKREKQKNIF